MAVIRNWLFVLLSLVPLSGYGCEEPANGWRWNKDELIEKSNSIFLAKVVGVVNTGPVDRPFLTFTLVPYEVLKGGGAGGVVYQRRSSYKEPFTSHDFNKHTDATFWSENIGRTKKRIGRCEPDHYFLPGHLYLVFPDAWGARASAEQIMSFDDKWLNYVREKLNDARSATTR